MKYIKRDLEKIISEVSEHFAAILITGPRQVGKTTMLRQLADENRGYVTLDDLDDRKLAQNDPALFLALHPAPLLIDEVQYAPQLFSYIKIAVDNGAQPGAFWMTGSQTFRLMELSQESLAGRVAILPMTALSQHEIYGVGTCEPLEISLESLRGRVSTGKKTETAGIYERIWHGAMPGLISGKYPERNIFYASYLQSYIQRDISDMLERVDALQFADFVRATACRTGQMLNVHDIAGDIGVTDGTAKRWLRLLETSGIIFYLRPYSNNLLKRTIKTPKMYFFDTGLVAYLTKYPDAEVLMNGAINGAILENYVVAEVFKSYLNNGLECNAWYYRDKDGKEIDLVLEHGGELHPIEIKKSVSPPSGISGTFRLLDNTTLPRSTGAVICMKDSLSAVDRQTLLLPIWML
jgi:predicted AAA+ superfamily ATPase